MLYVNKNLSEVTLKSWNSDVTPVKYFTTIFKMCCGQHKVVNSVIMLIYIQCCHFIMVCLGLYGIYCIISDLVL